VLIHPHLRAAAVVTARHSTAVLLTGTISLVSCAAGPAAWQQFVAPELEQLLVSENDQRWDRVDGSGWSYLRRGSSKDDQIAFDHGAPFSPPEVLKIIFTPDMGRDQEPSVHWMALRNAAEVYATWWIKLSPNWRASPAGGGKIAFLHASPDGRGQVYSNVGGSGAPHRININTEWAPYGQRFWEPNETSTPIRYGRWYRIDWHVRWPAPGSSHGVIRWWVDRALNGQYTDVRFPDGAGFQQFEFAPTLQEPPPDEQYMYIDHTSISVR
jgi:hypothetical protein